MIKNRDIKLSNIKGILILLVVFGHLLSVFQEDYEDLYLFIYSFHMPLFALVSGFFAKRVTIKKVIGFLLLLAIFQPLYRVFLLIINEERHFDLNIDVPYYHLWYLFALVVWYLIAMGISRLKLTKAHKVIVIILFFAIGLVARFIADPFEAFIHSLGFKFKGTSFSYMRIMTFLPYFFIGYFLSVDNMIKLYKALKCSKAIKMVMLISIYICITFLNPNNAELVFKGKQGIARMEGSLQCRIIYLIGGYIISLLICFIILNLVSDRESIFTKLGDRTLPIYLFHVFIVKIVSRIAILDEVNAFILLPLLLVLTFLIAMIFSNELFVKVTYYLCNPRQLIRAIKVKINM